MNYQQTLDYLYRQLPMFQRIGAAAFKKDLTNTIGLCEFLDNPHLKFKSIHVAGTNGKGSTSHMLAAIFQQCGYKTGLYTSPHLKNFTERIKINGVEISEQEVVDFVAKAGPALDEIKPSFFETTVAMAFHVFAAHQVDIAIIEVGLGGRLDSTNVITPELSLITNISLDHQSLLGESLPEIAIEKAGIIKKEIPVVISETQKEVQAVFLKKSQEMNTRLYRADQQFKVSQRAQVDALVEYEVVKLQTNQRMALHCDLSGIYQQKNIQGVLMAVEILKTKGFELPEQEVFAALGQVKVLTGIKGRWQTLSTSPLMICDTGHNEAGIKEILAQLKTLKFKKLHFVIGMVNDKKPDAVLSQLPKNAKYYFCQAKIPRALPAKQLAQEASLFGLKGEPIAEVNAAIAKAKQNAEKNDLIFIGGSSFVVAEIDNL